MRVGIDSVGRIVLPKHMRDELGITGPTEPDVILAWLEERFPGESLALPGEVARRALHTAAGCGVRGGALYDALIGATAAHFEHTLLSADRRAAPVYAALDVDVTYLEASRRGGR